MASMSCKNEIHSKKNKDLLSDRLKLTAFRNICRILFFASYIADVLFKKISFVEKNCKKEFFIQF